MQTLSSTNRPSDRKFGFTFAAIFSAAGMYGLFASWSPPVYWLCGLTGCCLLLLAAAAPSLLHPLNGAWFAFGYLLGRIVSPVVLGIIYFGILTPIAFTARLLGRDELRLKRRSDRSYWVDRDPPGPTGDSFTHQF